MRIILTLILTFCLFNSLFAQEANKSQATLISVSYGGQVPLGDMREQFGANFAVGASAQFMTKKKILIGLESYFFFSDQIKIDMLQNLRTPEGEIIGQSREYAVITQDERGFYVGLQVGKVLPVLQINENSGLRVSLSSGIMQHKIRIDDKTGDVPALVGEYAKGYDRLTNGLAFNGFLGYHYMANDGFLNFYAGFQFTQGFTQNRRSYDFLTMQEISTPRQDGLLGFKAGFILPIYKVDSPDEIFY